jgi:hypothetical protein
MFLLGACAVMLSSSFSPAARGQALPIPPREPDALSGSAFVQVITALSRADREDWILAQVLRGNVPEFLRTLRPITINATINGTHHTATYHVAPDYLAIGSDQDYFLCPMTPVLAQRICHALQCTLPTRRMVNQIWTNAAVKLSPAPIPPGPEMTTVPIFDQHNSMVRTQRMAVIGAHPLGELVSGTKKDVVISTRIYGNFANPAITRPVVIYGWHYTSGVPIQPLYNGHGETYADYSHGIRLVQMAMTLNGQPETVTNVCADPSLHPLLSDEGAIPTNHYSINPRSPRILVQPETQTVSPGEPASFRVMAAGDAPLAYQWQHQGTNLTGATLPTLNLPDAQSPNAGSYRVRITNTAGSILSSPSSLVVVTSPPRLNSIRTYPGDRIALGLDDAPAPRYLAQASSAFSSWHPVAALPGDEPSPPFLDPASASEPQRFYRVAQTTGVTLIDFEDDSVGSPALFQIPSYSGSTVAFIDVSDGKPNFAVVTTNHPTGPVGSRVLHVAWSFTNAVSNPWLRLTSHVAANLPNPTVQFSEGLCFDAYADRDLFIVLGLRETGTSQPIGSDGGVSGTIEWVGGTTDNSTAPPTGRRLPAGEWTRICFVTPEEPVRAFTGDGVLSSPTDKGVLEHLALLPRDGAGEYHLYLDNLQTFAPEP